MIRKLPPFSRFLHTAALANGEVLNFSKIGNDAQVSPSTVREYYTVLEDTLVGSLLPPWTFSKKRKAVSIAKFYFFDTGVVHTIARTAHLERNSDLYGRSFEHFLVNEIRSAVKYQRIRDPLHFWRSKHGHEVDIMVGDHFATEIKATTKSSERDAKGLRALQEEKAVRHHYLISQDRVHRKQDGIEYIHWSGFLEKLWSAITST